MNAHSKTIQPSRRDLVVGVSVVGGALLVGCSPADLLSAGAKTPIGAFGPFIKVAADGAVTVICKHIEFGQGSHAGLAAIVAEELDADWTRVGIEFAPANAKIYANSMMGRRGPAARRPSPTAGTSCARPAPPRGRCSSRRRPRNGRFRRPRSRSRTASSAMRSRAGRPASATWWPTRAR